MHSKKRIFYICISTLVLLICIIAAWTFCYARINTVRLLDTEVHAILAQATSPCIKIADCVLEPGDILIRRYITEGSLFTQTALGLYFTHAGFYLGNDQIVEAYGREENRLDGIRTDSFSTSMWTNDDVQNWVIIRPKKYNGTLDTIKNNLIHIADDPDYVFGIPKKGFKRALCADLILDQLTKYSLIKQTGVPKFITPDYLFLTMTDQQEDFQIIGYGIKR